MRILRTAYLSLGSNLGNRLDQLQVALGRIAEDCGHVVKVSSVYESASWGYEGEQYLNCCAEISTWRSPESLLASLLDIERELGRDRSIEKEGYQNRTIDLDILLFDQEIVFQPDLKIPHPRMCQRLFVLKPLVEIAAEVIHPVEKTSLEVCLSKCKDETKIEKIEATLSKPLTLLDRFSYIAIEGNIGSGKTSLSGMIAEEYNAKLVLERFADNPFLPKFYEDKERYAFPLEMSFLADRYQQLIDDLSQLDLFRRFMVSDYYIFKSLIFAQVTLAKEEFKLYRKMFDIMYKDVVKPDVYVYLYQSPERLLENIKKRGRAYEQNIQQEYLQKIHQGYQNFIQSHEGLNSLIIDVSDLDFVKNRKDFYEITRKIASYQP